MQNTLYRLKKMSGELLSELEKASRDILNITSMAATEDMLQEAAKKDAVRDL